jgi:hypothetical protein
LQLFLPQSKHIVQPWRDLSLRYTQEGLFGNESMNTSLGLIAAFGLLAVFGHLLAPGRLRLADDASRCLATAGIPGNGARDNTGLGQKGGGFIL